MLRNVSRNWRVTHAACISDCLKELVRRFECEYLLRVCMKGAYVARTEEEESVKEFDNVLRKEIGLDLFIGLGGFN